MTQQVDPRDSSSTHTGQAEPLSTFVFEGHTGSGTGTDTSNAGGAADRWPFLLNIRQAAVTFIQETAASTQPQRENLALLSAGPIIVFACVTGVSLAILIGIATVIVVVIQSIVVGIAGAILLFVLGAVVVLTVITFFCVVAGYAGFKIVRDIAVVVHGHHQQHVKRQQQQQQQQQQLHHQNKGEKPIDSSSSREI
ncbi:hypothetical protein BGX26_008835 [Mortierella sp. AD094]|nr:hypothetical protein BGX26_008835 [Mortierella sp. AD094]